LITLALVASGAQAGVITQYGLFPAGASAGTVVTSTLGGTEQPCTGPAGSTYESGGTIGSDPGYSKNGSGSSCTNLMQTTPIPNSTSDSTTANAEFQFAEFNTQGGLYTLTGITFQVYNYTVIQSTASNSILNAGSPLTYNIQDEILLSTSGQGTNAVPTQQDGTLGTPFYDDILNNTSGAYKKYSTIQPGTSSGPNTDYSSENPSTTFTDQANVGGVSSNTFTNTQAGISTATFACSGGPSCSNTANIFYQVLGTQDESGPTGNVTFAISNYVGTEIILTYDYEMTPTGGTPEPTTLLLLGSGLSFVAARLRRRTATK
jgi:hypothetical protein